MVLITINRALAYIFFALIVNIVDVYRLHFSDVYCKLIQLIGECSDDVNRAQVIKKRFPHHSRRTSCVHI